LPGLYARDTLCSTLKEEHFEDDPDQSVEGNTWPKEVGSKRKLEKVAFENFHALHYMPDIMRVINSRKVRWTVHVTYMEKDRNAFSG